MMHISNWSARRSGPSMTVIGRVRNETDASEVRVANVKLIEQRGRMVVAVTTDGDEHILKADL